MSKLKNRIPENLIEFDKVFQRTGVNQTLTIRERFFLYVDKKGDQECWNWKGSLLRNHTAPALSINQVFYDAKRLSYAMHNSDFDPLDNIYHICGNPLCVNPHHLYVKEKNFTSVKDIKNVPFYDTKNGVFLTWNKLREMENNVINKLYATGEIKQKTLSKIFNLDYSSISHIIKEEK